MRYARLLSTLGLPLVILLLTLPGASAHSGDLLSAYGTAKVDGVISPGEYGSCIGPVTQGIYTFTICETNDNTNDYYAVKINDLTQSQDDYINFWFDNNHDGVVGSGEDLIAVGQGIANSFLDQVYFRSGWMVDPTTQDGVGAVVFTAGSGYVFEASHPLNSGDPDDYSLSIGSTVGWCFTYDDSAVGPPPYTDVEYPALCYTRVFTPVNDPSGDASGYGNILKVGPALPPVGGEILAANVLSILSPWLAVTGLVGCVGTIVVVARKRRP